VNIAARARAAPYGGRRAGFVRSGWSFRPDCLRRGPGRNLARAACETGSSPATWGGGKPRAQRRHAVGDDRLQKQVPGRGGCGCRIRSRHGSSSEQRVRWFKNGFERAVAGVTATRSARSCRSPGTSGPASLSASRLSPCRPSWRMSGLRS
jgi:hypothetical protein